MPKYCRFHLFSDFSHFMCRDIPWNCWIVGNKLLSLSFQLKCSLRHCRIKKGKETRSFPNRNPFLLYLLSFHWLPERYKILKSFVGIDQFLFFMMWRKKECWNSVTKACWKQARLWTGNALFANMRFLADVYKSLSIRMICALWISRGSMGGLGSCH